MTQDARNTLTLGAFEHNLTYVWRLPNGVTLTLTNMYPDGRLALWEVELTVNAGNAGYPLLQNAVGDGSVLGALEAAWPALSKAYEVTTNHGQRYVVLWGTHYLGSREPNLKLIRGVIELARKFSNTTMVVLENKKENAS